MAIYCTLLMGYLVKVSHLKEELFNRGSTPFSLWFNSGIPR